MLPISAKEPLIILASARRHGDTESLVKRLFSGKDHKLVNLLDHHISPYSYSGKYGAEDCFPSIADQLLQQDRIILATPVYWYSMSGLLKTFFDRLTDLVTIDKPSGRRMAGRKVYVVAVGSDPEWPLGFEEPFKLTAAYFGMEYCGGYYCPTSDLTLQKLPKAASFVEQVYS
ncbi:flavodoxin family protein [Pontibacter litorisediminis]|uniref:flavodoxin family protein n=1 Tax=Pontibacter litorisediminis TaxID=1846260 RepID=UPI0023EC18A6|nr:NAD(P)H-dependent oxidoreductase [Pontibacter litorisediminis]